MLWGFFSILWLDSLWARFLLNRHPIRQQVQVHRILKTYHSSVRVQIFVSQRGSEGKSSACTAGDPGLISGLGRSPGEGNSYPLQYFSVENSMDREAWQATLCGVTKSWTPLSDFHFHFRGSVSSVTQSCPTLCNPMNHSMPGLPIHHQLPESTQTHVHQVCDAIQPSHPLILGGKDVYLGPV